MDRLATFRSFIEKSPADPFPRYGLAMELRAQGKLDEAAAAFAELLSGFPTYVPAYLMAGKLEESQGRTDQAADIYRRGVAAAQAKGDGHAKKELEAALDDLGAA
jgi:tetratricopeptide (TPR) repeat protein